MKPNIILITVDQMRADCLSYLGHPVIRTPHLDALCYEGRLYRNVYSNCPVCIPARTTIITGRDAHNNGCPSYREEFRVNLSQKDFLAGCITAGGYQTELIGKTHWHLEPSARAGFEHIQATELPHNQYRKECFLKTGDDTLISGLGGNEFSPVLSALPPELDSSRWIINQSLEFIDRRDQTVPFFLWVSLTQPHPPMTVCEPYYSMYDNVDIPKANIPEWCQNESVPYDEYCQQYTTNYGYGSEGDLFRKIRSVYYGMITNIDDQLGRLFGKLMMEGLWENSLILFTSDHGEKLGDFGAYGKRSFTEASANIPFILKLPQDTQLVYPDKDRLVELADIMPTFCESAGVEVSQFVTGHSLFAEATKIRTEIHGEIDGVHMFRTPDYKYLYFTNDGSELLFDMNNDHVDAVDLSKNEELCADMRNQLIAHLDREHHPMLKNGKLANLHKYKPSSEELRESNLHHMGLRWAAQTF